MEGKQNEKRLLDQSGLSAAKTGICAFEDTNWSNFCIPGENLNPCGDHKGGCRQGENRRWVGKSSSN